MSEALRSLSDVNNKLLEQLYDTICASSEPEQLLSLTEAVAKLNASSRNNDLVATKSMSEEEIRAEEDKAMFSRLAEGEIVDGN